MRTIQRKAERTDPRGQPLLMIISIDWPSADRVAVLPDRKLSIISSR